MDTAWVADAGETSAVSTTAAASASIGQRCKSLWNEMVMVGWAYNTTAFFASRRP